MPIRVATVRAADVPASQTNMPVFFDISRIGATALTLAEANSLRVYTDTDLVTQMAREIVSATEGHAKYPSLTSTSKIAMDFDGIRADYAVTDTFGRNNVWTGYNAVYHFEVLTTDDSGNGHTTTNVGSVVTGVGKLGGNSADFGSTNTTRYLHDNSGIGYTGTANFGATWWFKSKTAPTGANFQTIFTHNASTSSLGRLHRAGVVDISGVQNLRYFVLAGPPNTFADKPKTPGAAIWYHGALTHDGATVRAYDDGVEYNNYAKTGTYTNSANFLAIGSNSTTLAQDVWKGELDELRFSKTAQSANWITTEYNNQNAESTFWGTWTTFSGGAAAVNARRLFLMMV